MSPVRVAWLIARKDLVIEARSRELVLTTLFFAASCVLVFAFAFVRDRDVPPDAPAAILWIAMAFSGTLALTRVFERERQGETLRALLMAPSARAGVYLGKLMSLLCLMFLMEALLVPLVALFFRAPVFAVLGHLAALLAAGTIGFAALGTLFAAMLVRAQSRDVLLPVLLYPMTVPVLIAGVRGTAAILVGEPDFGAAQSWLAILVFFDTTVVLLALWTFAPVMSE